MPYPQDIYTSDNPLFRRNPVCALCWRECMSMCEEWDGHVNFDLLGSMEVADKLCRRLIANAWTLAGVEYYYHWMEGQLDFSRPAVTCATAVVCLTLRLMEGLNEELHQLGEDMRGLLWGEGGELYDNMRSEARRQDISLDAGCYGEIPPDPDRELKNINNELTAQVNLLSQEIQVMKQQNNQINIGTQNNNYGTIYNAPVTINNNYAAAPQNGEDNPKTHAEEVEPVAVDNSTVLPIPNKGKYTEVRRYIEERKRFDEEFKTYCINHSLRDLCARLTHEFGWFVDEHSLGSNINRNR